MAKTTYDLTNLGLAAGTHSITVRAKADGYEESEPSNVAPFWYGITVEVRMSCDATPTDESLYDLSTYMRYNAPASMCEYIIFNNYINSDVRFVYTYTFDDSIAIDWSSVGVAESLFNMTGKGTSFTIEDNDYSTYEFVSIERINNSIKLTYKFTDDAVSKLPSLLAINVGALVQALRYEIVFSASPENVIITDFGNRKITGTVDFVTQVSTSLVAEGGTTCMFNDDEIEPE